MICNIVLINVLHAYLIERNIRKQGESGEKEKRKKDVWKMGRIQHIFNFTYNLINKFFLFQDLWYYLKNIVIIKTQVSSLGLLKFCLMLNLNRKPSWSCNCENFGFGPQTVEHCTFLLLRQDAWKCLAVIPNTDSFLKILLKIEMWQRLNLWRETQAWL